MRVLKQLFVVIFLSSVVTLQANEGTTLPVCAEEGTAARCCPCTHVNSSFCNITCPDGFMEDSSMVLTCNSSITTIELLNYDTMDTIETTLNATTENESLTEVKICVPNCYLDQYYENDTSECKTCGLACLNCTGLSDKHCASCQYEYNKTCYKDCPEGTVVANSTNFENNTVTRVCEKPNTNKPADNVKQYIIIGSATGGALLVAIVIVIIVCCCCCRRKGEEQMTNRGGNTRRKTAMSTIIENKATAACHTDEKPTKRTAMGVGGSRDYANIEAPGPGFSLKVMQQADKVTRYTQDPTSSLDRRNEPSNSDFSEESPYSNAAMIHLHSKKDLTHLTEEKIRNKLEEEEIRELGEAPVVPRHPGQVNIAVPKSKKKDSIVKRLSQRVTRKFHPKQKSKPKVESEYYIDMSNAVSSEDTTVTPTGEEEEVELENYENVTMGQEGLTADFEDYENSATLRCQRRKGVNEDLEDYENAPGKRKAPSDDGQIQDDDLEDYENTQEFKIDEMPYENVKFGKK